LAKLLTIEAFKATLSGPTPPDVPPPLRALWYDAKGDWDRAHQVAQDIDDATGAWIHAYLHRKEGDLGNAAYWYERAGREVATDPLQTEWERIAESLIPRIPNP